ncbi:hypothetical protein B0H21DRAFT_755894 [Amylocystis lapponica]|nr:hypothetical protein B0H21DRAFT_755894 [Amylocystis lapponica]
MSQDPFAKDVNLHNYLHLVGITIFYYDYLRTFGDEVERVWRQPKPRTAYWFFLNRYLTFFGDIAVNVGNFYIFKTVKSCSQYALYRTLLLVLAQVVVCIILMLRTWALYRRDKRVLILILTVGISLLGLTCWAVAGEKSQIDLQGGCHTGLTRITAIHVAVPWEALFIYDVMIFSLTLYKTFQERPMSSILPAKSDIVSLVYRDGAIYFAVMASVNLANTVTFYTLQPLLRGVLSTFASSVSVTMMSHLMLNLHEGTLSNITAQPSTETSTTFLFTSRFTSRMLTDLDTYPDPDAPRHSDELNPHTADMEYARGPDMLEMSDIQVVRRESTDEHAA